jgi:2-dehydro-3-deoxyphosphooctonate aldolase (KDO 8-P synthase)
MAESLYTDLCARPFLIAGPCVLESRDSALHTAATLAEISAKLDLPLVFKSSFDKANRTSITSYRGPGLETGLQWLADAKKESGLPVTTDIHLPEQAAPVAEVVDILQIPAFLCRQTDLLVAAAETAALVNVKKGQFLAPWDMEPVVGKLKEAGCSEFFLTERGSSFGYNNLVVDFRSIGVLQGLGAPVIFDATHSVQLPGGKGLSSGGDRSHAPALAKAAAAVGVDGIFMETHPDPDNALCDGPNSMRLDDMEGLCRTLLDIWSVVRES